MFTLTLEIQDGVPPHLVTEIITRQLKEENEGLCSGKVTQTAQIGSGFRYSLTKVEAPYYDRDVDAAIEIRRELKEQEEKEEIR